MKLRFILKPLDTIFFGDEKSPFKQEYFQVSRMMPQQTTVLGLLRYEALRRSGKLGKDPKTEKWDELIGPASFNGTSGQTFGVIKSLSPVSIYHLGKKADLYPLRNPCGFSQIQMAASVDFGDGTQWDYLTLFEKKGNLRYDPKQHHQFSLIFSDLNGNSFRAECESDANHWKAHSFEKPKINSGIFWPDVRPGITKNYNGVPNDAGFFKTKFWRMMPGFAYSFVAEIEEHDNLKLDDWKNSAVVRFGGDRSLYSMSAVDAETNTETGSGNVFVLLSDALVDNKIYEHCTAAVSDTRHFRNLRTTTGDTKFTRRPNDWETWKSKPDSTEAKIFMQAGSILIAKDGEADNLAAALSKVTAYSNIGYNHFKRLHHLPKGIDHDKH